MTPRDLRAVKSVCCEEVLAAMVPLLQGRAIEHISLMIFLIVEYELRGTKIK
jgi:hypothetical protein